MGTATGLGVNVDVANGAFWTPQLFHQAARNGWKQGGIITTYERYYDALKPEWNEKEQKWKRSDAFRELRKMHRLKFTVKHRGKQDAPYKVYTVEAFTEHIGNDTGNARNMSFPKVKPDGSMGTFTIFSHFLKTYDIHLNEWQLPMIKTSRNGLYPMEVCHLLPNQPYKFKLNPEQTSNMIRFAVTRPKERLAAIKMGIDILGWETDPYLRHYGIQIDKTLTVTNARLLQNPEIQFNGSKINPGTSGRWDLRGKKFYLANPTPLKSWGIAAVDACVDRPTIDNFLRVFMQTYVGHGGKIVNKNPVIYIAPDKAPPREAVTELRKLAGEQCKIPRLLVCASTHLLS